MVLFAQNLVFTVLVSALALTPILPGSVPEVVAEVNAESCPPGAIEIGPDESIQRAVDDAEEGVSFCLKQATHRLQEIIPKNSQSFYGEGETILNGAREITAFERDGSLWVASDQRQRHARHGQCAKSSPTCNMPEAFFLDDRPLRRVLSKEEVVQGSFYLDHRSGRLYFADDPRGRKVEATVARFAFAGHASNVVIKNLVVEKYSSPAQFGAINGRAAKDWTVKGVEARWNSGGGIAVGSGGRVVDCNIHHNGQLGVRVIGSDVILKGNKIWENNIFGFDQAWEAGGVKITESDKVQLVENHVRHNAGTGLWCDINCRDVVYEANLAEYNAGPGIFHEISFDAIIRKNTLRHNGTSGYRWVWNDEIQIAASEQVEVYDNDITVRPGGGAIMLVDQGRSPQGRWRQTYKTRNNYVHHNRITFEGDGSVGGASDTGPSSENYGIISEGDNLFDFNTYRLPKGASIIFAWGDRRLAWAGFREQGQELNGTLTVY